jgi:hypothetical protein
MTYWSTLKFTRIFIAGTSDHSADAGFEAEFEIESDVRLMLVAELDTDTKFFLSPARGYLTPLQSCHTW